MKLSRLVLAAASFMIAGLLFSSCVRRNAPVSFDNSDPLALDPDIQWAVVHDPYAAFRKETSYDSEVTGHSRQGDILQVAGFHTVQEDKKEKAEQWYAFDQGWLPASTVDIYSNKLKAQTAASVLLKK
jgi:hypothetical protein